MRTIKNKPEPSLRSGQVIYGTNDHEALHGWKLKSGSHFAPHGSEQQIEMTGTTEAIWSRAIATDYTLVFSFQLMRGTGGLSLQRSGERGKYSEYRLQLAHSRITLERFSGRKRGEKLGSAPIKLTPDRWHTCCVESCNGWKRVTIDNYEVLNLIDPNPLPSGTQVFCSSGKDNKIAYTDIHLTPWATGDAIQIRENLDRFSFSFKPRDKRLPDFIPHLRQPLVVPLENAVFKYDLEGKHKYERTPVRINPGTLPPNFVHTWILDLKGIETFRLHFASFDDIKLHKDDRVSIYNLQGLKSKPPQPLVSFTTSATEDILTADLSKAPYDKVRTGTDYKRVYIQLETSPEYTPRRFIISGIEINNKPSGTEEALLFGDDIDYSSVIIAEEKNKQGISKSIPAPWVPGYYTHYNNLPLPDPSKGWYLVAKYLTNPDQSIYALVYYNEQRSLLWIYLYNLDIPINVTGATVTVSMERYTPAIPDLSPYPGKAPLSGALFSLHPNPNRWSSAEIPLLNWGPGTWVCVEVPMLYPMADNTPVDLSKAAPLPPSVNYRSLYEEPMQKGLRGILLKLHINTYDLGQFEGTLTGQAVGEAIEKLNQQPGFFDNLKSAGGAAGDIFKNGYEVYKGVKDFYDNTIKNPPKDMSTFKFLSNVVGAGASVFSGIGGVVGAALSFVNVFIGDPKLPMRMAIMLDLNAKFTGQLKIQHNLGPSVAFYLPGRFAIDEAVSLGLLADDPDTTALWAPRYDRSMGLFGYRYQPSEVIFPLYRGYRPGIQYDNLDAVFPALQYQSIQYGLKITVPFRDNIERLLPIVYNSFAEIIPMKPIVVKSDTAPWPEQNVDYATYSNWPMFDPYWGMLLTKWHFDIAWKTHVIPEPDDVKFPPDTYTQDSEHGPALSVRVRFHDDARNVEESTIYYYGAFEYNPKGLLIQVHPIPECVPQTYKDFKNVYKVKTLQKYYRNNVKKAEDSKGNVIGIMDIKDTYPYDTVAYVWDIPFFYYGRSRKSNGTIPSLRSTAHMYCPVMLLLTTSQFYEKYEDDSNTWIINEERKSQFIPSKLLEP